MSSQASTTELLPSAIHEQDEVFVVLHPLCFRPVLPHGWRVFRPARWRPIQIFIFQVPGPLCGVRRPGALHTLKAWWHGIEMVLTQSATVAPLVKVSALRCWNRNPHHTCLRCKLLGQAPRATSAFSRPGIRDVLARKGGTCGTCESRGV